MIEARIRIGGRAYSRPFAGSPDESPLEFGGSWITPWHHRIRSLVRQFDLGLRPREKLSSRIWMKDGLPHTDGPLSASELKSHERTLARIAADAVTVH